MEAGLKKGNISSCAPTSERKTSSQKDLLSGNINTSQYSSCKEYLENIQKKNSSQKDLLSGNIDKKTMQLIYMLLFSISISYESNLIEIGWITNHK